jgi:hypothetical protein
MEMDALWDVLLTAIIGFMVWWLKAQHDETKRIQILLNRTREDYVTKVDNNAQVDRVLSRLDSLDMKIDRILERK